MFENLRPQYAKQFRCIGPRCEDDCCHGWGVIVDQETYQKYQGLPTLRPRLTELFTIVPDNSLAANYTIALRNDGLCPFFTPQRLCSIHQSYGESYLSKTCSTYPRTVRRIDGLLEIPLTLSCPEAARLVLLNSELLPGYRQQAGDRGYTQLLKILDPPAGKTLQPIHYFWELRHFCLRLVQDPAYTLWQRLFVLGMFCKKLEDLVHTSRADLIPQLVREYARIAVENRLQSALERLPARNDPQLKMLFEVVRTYLQNKSASQPHLKDCLDDFVSGLQTEPDASSESTVTAYSAAYEKHYAPFMARYPYLLENYLLNYMFRLEFPFGSGHPNPSPINEYVFMCLEFAVIKGLLIGISGHYRENFTPDHVIKVVQVITKTIEHNEPLRSAINWQGLSQPITMAALLMN